MESALNLIRRDVRCSMKCLHANEQKPLEMFGSKGTRIETDVTAEGTWMSRKMGVSVDQVFLGIRSCVLRRLLGVFRPWIGVQLPNAGGTWQWEGWIFEGVALTLRMHKDGALAYLLRVPQCCSGFYVV